MWETEEVGEIKGRDTANEGVFRTVQASERFDTDQVNQILKTTGKKLVHRSL